MFFSIVSLGLLSLTPVIHAKPLDNAAVVDKTSCNGKTYIYEGLAGYGLLPSDARDVFGDTLGGVGSSIALEKKSWKKKKGKDEGYEAIIYGIPDRGWNTNGTQNTQGRIHKFHISLDIVKATSKKPAKPNIQLKYLDTILLTGPDGAPTTGLDADAFGSLSYKGFPDLPVATYTGNGFGGAGPGGKRISIDAEGLVIGDDGTFWVSDEYGPYIYQFTKQGKMIAAISPPDAFIPVRNGNPSFGSATPPLYNKTLITTPADPTSGRANNQGLEALTASPDGHYLYSLLQSATTQDGGGGAKSTTRRNTRFLKYRLQKPNSKPHSNSANRRSDFVLEAEYAVQLPLIPGSGKVAAQSEIIYISPSQFLVLARDGGAGHGQSASESKYRNADVIDISGATNILGKYDSSTGSIANLKGELKSEITPATYCPWLSYNNNDELAKFGLHNGGDQDAGLLNEKWESFALGPVGAEFKTKGDGEEYYLISVSDNDFVTQNGYINNGKIAYADESGYNIDTQILAFKVCLPKGADPLL